ncbi:hypothetical protein DKX38_019376 [Salix brachista]|uniref:Protein kinase domain-containing protein n=1 Tax=Salix brachista TaxID=2182728 RepID=A0A5N5KG38_9ROSI|nr:hypothetical protein DKX38_019376 [Salix brachista]
MGFYLSLSSTHRGDRERVPGGWCARALYRIGGMTTCWETKKDKKVNKETAFIRNGSKLLEKLVDIWDGKCNSIRRFSATELKKATNNYDPRKLLTTDSFYKLYKGFLQGRAVSVKKFKHGDKEYEYCFNDIVYASKMSAHKSFVKLLGCCLETQIPILVFEYVGNRTLSDCLWGSEEAHCRPLLWIPRSKIAMDMANAVAFLHAAFAKPIVYRNMKPTNILLDDNHEAKLSDFSYSISIPKGESHVSDVVKGTLGLIAPEYVITGNFKEKLDVFNFGVILLMLLSGQTLYDRSRPAEEILLLHHVKKCVEDDRLNKIIDSTIIAEGAWPGKEQQLQAFAALALRCISLKSLKEEDRPSMIDVSKELRKIHQLSNSNWFMTYWTNWWKSKDLRTAALLQIFIRYECLIAVCMLRPYVGNVVKMCQHDSSRGKLLDNRRVVICSVDVIFGLSFVLVFSMVVCDLQTGLGVINIGTIYVSVYSKQCSVVRSAILAD